MVNRFSYSLLFSKSKFVKSQKISLFQKPKIYFEFLYNKHNIFLETASIIELYVYNIALFHADRLDINIDDIYITFHNVVNSATYFSEDKNNNRSFLTCITYINTSDNLSIITNINHNDYKYKNLNNNKIFISKYTIDNHI